MTAGRPVTFPPAGPYAERVACSDCGSLGYPGGRWQDKHRRGHSTCPDCGRALVVKLDGTPRVHTRCRNRPEKPS